MPGDLLKKLWVVLAEAVSSFRRNNDLTAASSLAFSAMLALIPALFLLTFLLGAAIGSSARALQRTQELMTQLVPAYSQDIMREVRVIASHKGTIGSLNLLVLFWSITPLVADFRVTLGSIFRKKPSRPFLLEKLFDVAIGVVFLVGLSAAAIAGVALTVMGRMHPLRLLPAYIGEVAPFAVVSGVVFALYFTFSSKLRVRHLIVAALIASSLWFLMRPAFHIFLMYNPGYGFAFGSFKSLFVVIIWIYFSLVLLLFGAEIGASLGRKETVFIKKLMEGKRGVPASVFARHVVRYEKGSIIFNEGDKGSAMFSVHRGRVGIVKDGRQIAEIGAGKCFGEMSFLLSAPRVASAVALDDVELVTISNENINSLMNEFPEFVVEMLREMALRLREANRLID